MTLVFLLFLRTLELVGSDNLCMSRRCPYIYTLHADQIYNTIGVALTSSANFFINYVVFQVRRFTLPDAQAQGLATVEGQSVHVRT